MPRSSKRRASGDEEGAAGKKQQRGEGTEGDAPALRLKYWQGRGLMEPGRVLLALKGRWPGSGYADLRHVDAEDLAKQKALGKAFKGCEGATIRPMADAGPLDANLGRLPVLECEQGAVGQSLAIYVYLASELELAGKNAFELASIVSFAEHLREMDRAYRALVPYGTAPSAALSDLWFNPSEATDYAGPANAAHREARRLRWFLGRMEGLVGPKFCVGGAMSLADVLLWSALEDHLPADDAHRDLPKHTREPFGDHERTHKLLAAEYPKLAKVIEGVAKHSHLKKWLKMRGTQLF